MFTANRQRLLNAKNHEAAGQEARAMEQRAKMQPYLITLLKEAHSYHQGLPEDDEITLIDETARQSRTFVAEGAQGKVEGLSEDDIAGMKFLDTIMHGLGEHPPLEPGKPLVPQLGSNNYQTEQRDWSDPKTA